MLGEREKEIHWDPAKDEWLRIHRRLGFEQVAAMIENDDYLTIVDYGYYVPFVESEFSIFLKTIIRSRKATKLYLRGG